MFVFICILSYTDSIVRDSFLNSILMVFSNMFTLKWFEIDFHNADKLLCLK